MFGLLYNVLCDEISSLLSFHTSDAKSFTISDSHPYLANFLIVTRISPERVYTFVRGGKRF